MLGDNDAIQLLAAGDMCFADHPLCRGFGVQAMLDRHGVDFPFARVAPLLAEADLAFGNLETTLAHPAGAEADLFRGPPAVAAALSRHRFQLMSVANNHTLQHGEPAFAETLSHLAAHGVQAVGRPGGDGYSSQPVLRNLKGQTLAFLAYAFTRENFHPDVRCYARSTPQQVYADVARVKAGVDQVVVACHWGVELAGDPTPGQVALGRGIIDAGASVVLGHHPHVWQGVEEHGNGVIFYSLGDFIFDLAWCRRCRQTGLAKIRLARGERPRWEVVPAVINRSHQPVPSAGPARDAFLARLEAAAGRLPATVAAEPDVPPSAAYLAGVKACEAANQRAKVFHVLRNLHRLGPTRFARIALKQARILRSRHP